MESPICGLKTTWTSSLLSSCSCILDEFRMAGRRRLIHGQVYCRFIPSGGSSDLHCNVCVCERLKSTSYPGSLWLSRFGSCAVVRTQPDKAAAWLGAGIPRLLR